MHISIASTYTPLISGGAEILEQELAKACERAGYQVSFIRHAFCDESPALLADSIRRWENEDLALFGSRYPDVVIGLKFPAYLLQHPYRVNWLLHQHRSMYELWDWQAAQGHVHSAEDISLRAKVHELDYQALHSAIQNFTISKTVTARLAHYNQLLAESIYHPPKLASVLSNKRWRGDEGFIFAPSRLEPLKRQRLLIEAIALTRYPVKAVICGRGSQAEMLTALIHQLGVADRVLLLDYLSESQLVDYYQRCRAVFFTPYDEDYGYITLEAMVAGKPVITCYDSGGPNEFVVDGTTGYSTAPEPQQIAEILDTVYCQPALAVLMGEAGYERYQSLDLSWDKVLEKLLF